MKRVTGVPRAARSAALRGAWTAALMAALMAASPAGAQPAAGGSGAAPAGKVQLDEHARKDIERHRAMAAAHEAAARCLESGKGEEACQKQLQESCKGLAIGKYCGMRHVH